MPTKRAILARLTAKELRTGVDSQGLHVGDRRVKAQLVDALAGSRKARLGEMLPELSRNRLKALCRAFSLDDTGRSKADLVARLVGSDAVSNGDGGQAPPAELRAVRPVRRPSRSQGDGGQPPPGESRSPGPRSHAPPDSRGDGGKVSPATSGPAASRPAASRQAASGPAASRPATSRPSASGATASRAAAKTPGPPAGTQAATTGHEAELWRMADALRGSMDAAEYKHVVLGLVFLKYISDAFEEMHARLEGERDQGADPEDPDEYRAENIFWVPPEARWSRLAAQARQSAVGRLVDDAMAAIERDNPALADVLPRDYARPALDKQRLGQLIDMVGNIRVGDAEARSRDVLGRVYEYFLSRFASAEGKKGGEFYTPRCVVRLLVEMLEPWRGRVYDPCCGSSGMFVQSVEFIRAHATGNGNGGRARGDISVYGQESNYTTWRLAKMNLAIRGIEGRIAHGDSFHDDRHPDLRADFILANPPFNVSDWGGERLAEDKRWRYGVPPPRNANFAWVQHIVHHLAPAGAAGFVLANGSMSSAQSGEGEIRKSLIEADLVDCMVALPGQLFYSTQIPACLWFLARDRTGGAAAGVGAVGIGIAKTGTTGAGTARVGTVRAGVAERSRPFRDTGSRPAPAADSRGAGMAAPAGTGSAGTAATAGVAVRSRPFRDRRGEVLFIDARQLGRMVDRTHRELTDEDIARIADTYHAWRGETGAGDYADVPGFCKAALLEEVRRHSHVLTPGRYVGAAPQEEDDEPFEEKMTRLVAQLREQQAEGAKLDAAIEANLAKLGFEMVGRER